MSIQSAYRRSPEYMAVPLALLASGVMALVLAALGAVTLYFLPGRFDRADDLDNAILGFFFVAPSIAVPAFVCCFSALVNLHHKTSWQTPTFAFALGGTFVWIWPLGFGEINFPWYSPGIVAWLVSCWILRRKGFSSTGHVLQA